jgi:hypothetical protein
MWLRSVISYSMNVDDETQCRTRNEAFKETECLHYQTSVCSDGRRNSLQNSGNSFHSDYIRSHNYRYSVVDESCNRRFLNHHLWIMQNPPPPQKKNCIRKPMGTVFIFVIYIFIYIFMCYFHILYTQIVLLLCLLLQKVVNDPVYSSLCSVVDHQILVMQWCKKHGHRYSFNNRDFLELTKEHSTLEVLRRTASLEDLELNEARVLLLNNEQGNWMELTKAFPKRCIQLFTYQICLLWFFIICSKSLTEWMKCRGPEVLNFLSYISKRVITQDFPSYRATFFYREVYDKHFMVIIFNNTTKKQKFIVLS